MKRPRPFAVLAAVLLAGPLPLAALPLGVSLPMSRDPSEPLERRLDELKALGFASVTFIPNFAYPGLDKVDAAEAPDWDEVGRALAYALRIGLQAVVKPHLEPPMYTAGFDSFRSESHSWRTRCPWRGYFDVDPMSKDYRRKVVLPGLAALADALAGVPAGHGPVRFELGTELMNSTVYHPQRWVELLAVARLEVAGLGLKGRVVLSHDFSHHIEIAEDFVLRMDPAGRRALARYIKGLDAVALSQYMDLTAAVPASQRDKRLPTPAEIARALVIHEADFRQDILVGLLGLKPSEIPELHIGEFGVGRGGLRHPNLWEGPATPDEDRALRHEIALGHRGLIEYLRLKEGRTARSATLWVTGRYFDVFGWMEPGFAVPEAADAIKEGLR
ncbi:MAG: hypothetical protein HY927_07585 [Elusimicrobia bacterium]|nr:hypothetical protein [Elusimicrobiota bacterium]